MSDYIYICKATDNIACIFPHNMLDCRLVMMHWRLCVTSITLLRPCRTERKYYRVKLREDIFRIMHVLWIQGSRIYTIYPLILLIFFTEKYNFMIVNKFVIQTYRDKPIAVLFLPPQIDSVKSLRAGARGPLPQPNYASSSLLEHSICINLRSSLIYNYASPYRSQYRSLLRLYYYGWRLVDYLLCLIQVSIWFTIRFNEIWKCNCL